MENIWENHKYFKMPFEIFLEFFVFLIYNNKYYNI